MNSTTSSPGLVGTLADFVATSGTGATMAFALASVIAVFVLDFLVTVKPGPEEPPVAKPAIPLVGHILGLLWEQSSYFPKVFKRVPHAIMTLPMLNGRVYLATDPVLIQAALRNKALSFTPFTLNFIQRVLGVESWTFKILQNKRDDDKVVPESRVSMLESFQGKNLHRMNLAVLQGIAERISAIPSDSKGIEIDNFWIWLRDLTAAAMLNGLFGKTNDPFAKNPSLIQDFWEFEGSIASLAFSPSPKLTHPHAIAARNRCQEAIGEYLAAGYDQSPETSFLMRENAAAHRRDGITDTELGKLQFALILPAVQNALPALLWFILNVYRRPDFVSRIRDEVLPLFSETKNSDGSREVAVDISILEDQAPFLHACYKEVLRVSNAQQGTRRVMEDTYLTDATGRRWLVKAGVDIWMPANITHRLEDVWEHDPEAFDPNNFFLSPDDDKDNHVINNERQRRSAYIPFGGGKHYCPGRKIALYENLAFIAVLVAGFELEPLGSPEAENNILKTEMRPLIFGEGVRKPANNGEGKPARLRKKEGWENVTWKFVC